MWRNCAEFVVNVGNASAELPLWTVPFFERLVEVINRPKTVIATVVETPTNESVHVVNSSVGLPASPPHVPDITEWPIYSTK